MGMSVTISVATEQDAEQIFRLQYLCFQSEAALYGNYRIAPLVQTLDSVKQELAADCVYVARLGDEVVGSVRGSITEDGAASIARLCVHPRLQGHGIGARLLRAAEAALAEERGATQHRPPQRGQPPPVPPRRLPPGRHLGGHRRRTDDRPGEGCRGVRGYGVGAVRDLRSQYRADSGSSTGMNT